jgi:hypothetical protein
MNDQHYAAPTANLAADSGNLADVLKPLSDTKPWVRLCSILGFILTFFSVIGGIGVMFAGSAMDGATAGMPVPMSVLGVFYLVFAFFYFMPSLYLFKYASAIASAEVSHSSEDIATAVGYQKSFWKFVGIIALIITVIMVVGILAAIVLPMVA